MNNVIRWICAIVIPFVFMFIVSIVGTLIATSKFIVPWIDSDGTPDALTLLASSFVSGVILPLSAYSIAPRNKIATMIVLSLIWVLYVLYGMFSAYDLIGKFGLIRHAIGIVGIIITITSLLNKREN